MVSLSVVGFLVAASVAGTADATSAAHFGRLHLPGSHSAQAERGEGDPSGAALDDADTRAFVPRLERTVVRALAPAVAATTAAIAKSPIVSNSTSDEVAQDHTVSGIATNGSAIAQVPTGVLSTGAGRAEDTGADEAAGAHRTDVVGPKAQHADAREGNNGDPADPDKRATNEGGEAHGALSPPEGEASNSGWGLGLGIAAALGSDDARKADTPAGANDSPPDLKLQHIDVNKSSEPDAMAVGGPGQGSGHPSGAVDDQAPKPISDTADEAAPGNPLSNGLAVLTGKGGAGEGGEAAPPPPGGESVESNRSSSVPKVSEAALANVDCESGECVTLGADLIAAVEGQSCRSLLTTGKCPKTCASALKTVVDHTAWPACVVKCQKDIVAGAADRWVGMCDVHAETLLDQGKDVVESIVGKETLDTLHRGAFTQVFVLIAVVVAALAYGYRRGSIAAIRALRNQRRRLTSKRSDECLPVVKSGTSASL